MNVITSPSSIMIKTSFYLVLVAAFLSCRGYRTAEGKVKPVYFTADEQIFKDSIYPPRPFWHRPLQSLGGNTIEKLELREGDITKAFIQKPTFFSDGYNLTLLYPREKLLVSTGAEDGIYNLSITNRSRRRNREAAFFQTFQKLERQLPDLQNLHSHSVQDVLNIETEHRNAFAKAEVAAHTLFDSLLVANQVSKKFQKLALKYINNRYDISILSIFNRYKDSMTAGNVYTQKLRGLVPVINAIKERSKFNENVKSYLNDLVDELFPNNSMWSFDEEGFKTSFDSIEITFTNRAREYLLSRIMYRAYAKGVKVPLNYVEKYNRYCSDNDYQNIVINTKREREKNDADMTGIKSMLLFADGKFSQSFEKILALHRGKFILIDLWASWCGPCLKEFPYLTKLREKSPEDKIVFMTISLDKQIASWRQTMTRISMATTNSYLLLDASKTSFYKQYNIRVIPRYMLFGKDGKIVNDNMPSPSDAALTTILDKLVLN